MRSRAFIARGERKLMGDSSEEGAAAFEPRSIDGPEPLRPFPFMARLVLQ